MSLILTLTLDLATPCLFSRMQIKSPNGLVIEDIQDLHILTKILDTMAPTTENRSIEGFLHKQEDTSI